MPQTIYLGTYSQPKRINEVELFKYKRIDPLPILPISINEFQSHIRIDIPLEQTSYLNLIIKNAVRYAEEYLNLSLVNTKWCTFRNTFDENVFELRKGYFVSIDKFQYIDSSTNLYVDVDPSIYYTAEKQYHTQILLKMGKQFPIENLLPQDNSILIEFTAGMASDDISFENLYPDLKMALLQHCCFAYENRGNDIFVNSNQQFNALPVMITDVYDRYRDISIFGGVIYNI